MKSLIVLTMLLVVFTMSPAWSWAADKTCPKGEFWSDADAACVTDAQLHASARDTRFPAGDLKEVSGSANSTFGTGAGVTTRDDSYSNAGVTASNPDVNADVNVGAKGSAR